MYVQMAALNISGPQRSQMNLCGLKAVLHLFFPTAKGIWRESFGTYELVITVPPRPTHTAECREKPHSKKLIFVVFSHNSMTPVHQNCRQDCSGTELSETIM